jgi:hypothetical protein
MKNMGMGRAAFGFGLAWSITIGATAITLPGCASDPSAERDQAGEAGTIDLALSGTSASGTLYRLRDAQIDVTGAASASVASEDHLGDAEVSLELPAGGYIADLLDGWRLERSLDGGVTFTDVPAILVSTDPLPFVVVDQERTDVRLVFRAGEDVVELGNGRVVIGIDVIDGEAPRGGSCEEACSVAEGLGCPVPELCFDICQNLTDLLGGPTCIPQAEVYMACADGEPGDSYVCYTEGYPIAGACEPEFQAVIDCLTAPCEDGDGDGFCVENDCDDADPSVFPGAPDICNDGVDSNCDGDDVTACAPVGWNCPTDYYGTADGCDCGCGVVDPDCAGPTVSACEYCNDPGSCSSQDCGGNTEIDPNNNAICN